MGALVHRSATLVSRPGISPTLGRAIFVLLFVGAAAGCAPQVGLIVPQELHADRALEGWRAAARSSGVRLAVLRPDLTTLLSPDGFDAAPQWDWWQWRRRAPVSWVLLGGNVTAEVKLHQSVSAELRRPALDRSEAVQLLAEWLSELSNALQRPVFLAIAPAVGARQAELSVLRAAFRSSHDLQIHSYTIAEGQLRELDRFTTDTARLNDFAAIVVWLGSATPRALRVLAERAATMTARPTVIAEVYLSEHATEIQSTLAAEAATPGRPLPDAWIAFDVAEYLRGVGAAMRQESPWPAHLYGRLFR